MGASKAPEVLEIAGLPAPPAGFRAAAPPPCRRCAPTPSARKPVVRRPRPGL